MRMKETMKIFKSGFNERNRTELRSELEDYVKALSEKYNVPDEAIIQEIRYWQQKYTNPTKAQKFKSFKSNNQICFECKTVITQFEDATFHHIQRGIPNVHSPKNMVPMHRSMNCHEKHHGIKKN